MLPYTLHNSMLCSLSSPRVGHTMDVLSPFISVLYHSDWLFHGESCPRLDVVHPDRVWSSSSVCTWHCSLHYLFLQATPLFPHQHVTLPGYHNYFFLCMQGIHTRCSPVLHFVPVACLWAVVYCWRLLSKQYKLFSTRPLQRTPSQQWRHCILNTQLTTWLIGYLEAAAI